jgi:hypothetical protein
MVRKTAHIDAPSVAPTLTKKEYSTNYVFKVTDHAGQERVMFAPRSDVLAEAIVEAKGLVGQNAHHFHTIKIVDKRTSEVVFETTDDAVAQEKATRAK